MLWPREPWRWLGPPSLAVSGGGGAATHVGDYYHEDNLNSSSVMSGSAGQQLEGNVWYPFGRTQTATPQAPFKVSNQFTGQIKDEETGLYYYGARYYDPELGRFVQPDRIIPDLENPQSYNRYAYCLNNPLKYVDPDGHWGQEAADWWQATVQAGASYISASPSHWVWNGTVGTLNGIVGGIAEPLRLGSAAGRISVERGTASQIALATFQEGTRVAAVIPAGAALGKAAGTVTTGLETAGREAAAELATEVGQGGLRVRVNPNTGELGGVNISGINRVHGNSKLSPELQHRYEIVENQTGDVVKTGISGQTPLKSGASPRANPQVNKLNVAEGPGTYSARVPETGIPGRAAGLNAERVAATQLGREGNSLRPQRRPRPED